VDAPDDCFDIAVIGAGPAGALTAWTAARARPDLRIALIDAMPAPEHRPCGEYLAPHGVAVLAESGLEAAVLATGACPLSGVTLEGPHGAMRSQYCDLATPHLSRGNALGVRRERFDAALQQAVAPLVSLLRPLRLTAMRREAAAWRLDLLGGDGERVLHARMVVGADGRLSQVRRLAGLDRPVGRKRYALVCRARNLAHRQHVEMHLSPLGQIGLAPLGENECNLNLLLAEPSRALLRSRPRAQVMRAALAATPSLAARCHGISLGPVMATGSLPQDCTSVVGDGIALVGDAAGFCDPFSGDGMSFALTSGRQLGHCLAALDLATVPDATALAPYARAYHAAIGCKRRIGDGLNHLLARRGLSERLVGVLARSRPLTRLLLGMAAGYRPPPRWL